jgi:hypothetical protein
MRLQSCRQGRRRRRGEAQAVGLGHHQTRRRNLVLELVLHRLLAGVPPRTTEWWMLWEEQAVSCHTSTRSPAPRANSRERMKLLPNYSYFLITWGHEMMPCCYRVCTSTANTPELPVSQLTSWNCFMDSQPRRLLHQPNNVPEKTTAKRLTNIATGASQRKALGPSRETHNATIHTACTRSRTEGHRTKSIRNHGRKSCRSCWLQPPSMRLMGAAADESGDGAEARRSPARCPSTCCGGGNGGGSRGGSSSRGSSSVVGCR